MFLFLCCFKSMELGLLTNFIDISILNLLNNSINSSIYADLTILNLYDYTLPNNPINLPITPLDLGENRSHFRRFTNIVHPEGILDPRLDNVHNMIANNFNNTARYYYIGGRLVLLPAIAHF